MKYLKNFILFSIISKIFSISSEIVTFKNKTNETLYYILVYRDLSKDYNERIDKLNKFSDNKEISLTFDNKYNAVIFYNSKKNFLNADYEIIKMTQNNYKIIKKIEDEPCCLCYDI